MPDNRKKTHRVWDAPNVKTGYDEGFADDRYVMAEGMAAKYRFSKEAIPPRGNLRPRETMLFKNVSIFDITGTKITWGDIAPEDVRMMLGVYYILSEHKSFWNPPENAVIRFGPVSEDPNSRSPFRELLPEKEPMIMSVRYVKANAIARIVDGEIHTSRQLLMSNYQ